MDSYLSPEMKSTGEAIGYDDKLTRALYKALQATGMNVSNYGTIFVTIADHDKEQALPLVRRFYDLGFNIEATAGTAMFLKENGIVPQAWYTLEHGDKALLQESLFAQLGEKYGKYAPQIILRRNIRSSSIVIPGSKNPEHIKANFDRFDFALTDAEMVPPVDEQKRKTFFACPDAWTDIGYAEKLHN